MKELRADMIDQHVVDQVNALCEILSPGKVTHTYESLLNIAKQPNTLIIINTQDDDKPISDSNPINGIGCLFFVHSLMGLKAIMRELIVAEDMRRTDLGKEIVLHLVDLAKEHKADSITLTIKPLRIEASMLFSRLGFDRIANANNDNKSLELTNLFKMLLK